MICFTQDYIKLKTIEPITKNMHDKEHMIEIDAWMGIIQQANMDEID